MPSQSDESLNELLKQCIRVGVVTETNPAKGTVRVQCVDADGLVTKPLRVLNHKTLNDKAFWMPDINEHVLCLFLPHGPEQGFVLGAFYSEADATPVQDQDKHHVVYKDGTWLEYDRKEHKLHGVVKGDVELLIEKNAVIEVKEQADVTVHKDCTVDSKQTLHLKGKSAVIVHTANFQLVSYDGQGGAVATMESDIRHIGRYEQEGDYLQTGNKVQTGNQTTQGEVKADLFRGPIAGA